MQIKENALLDDVMDEDFPVLLDRLTAYKLPNSTTDDEMVKTYIATYEDGSQLTLMSNSLANATLTAYELSTQKPVSILCQGDW